jgi:hypothetical protein
MKRILFSDNGTLKDFTSALNNYASGTKNFNYTVSQDALYIGSKMPFNHVYFKLGAVNSVSANMSVAYWNSNAWEPVVELMDETNGLTQSGMIKFFPSKQSTWQMSSTNSDGQTVDGLTSIKIYDLYWLKITFDQTLTSTTYLDWVGNIFSNDDDLSAEFPDFAKSSVKTSFKPGKQDWEEQHVKAANILAQDLIDKGIIYETGQILNAEDYRESSVMKCAEIIFRALGDDFSDQRQQAREEYQLRLAKRIHVIDTNADAIEQVIERRQESGWLSR